MVWQILARSIALSVLRPPSLAATTRDGSAQGTSEMPVPIDVQAFLPDVFLATAYRCRIRHSLRQLVAPDGQLPPSDGPVRSSRIPSAPASRAARGAGAW